MSVKTKSYASGWWGYSAGGARKKCSCRVTVLGTAQPSLHQSWTSLRAWVGTDLPQLRCSFYPVTQSRDGKYLVCHQYSPLLWPQQTSVINHRDSFPLSLNIASESSSTQLSRQQRLINQTEEETKLVCQPDLEAMKFSKSVFTRGKVTWISVEAYYSSRCLRRPPCLQDYHLPDYLFL